MSDTAEDKPCKYINLEDNSIKDIRELHRRGRAKTHTEYSWTTSGT
jgi:hypothetical protein